MKYKLLSQTSHSPAYHLPSTPVSPCPCPDLLRQPTGQWDPYDPPCLGLGKVGHDLEVCLLSCPDTGAQSLECTALFGVGTPPQRHPSFLYHGTQVTWPTQSAGVARSYFCMRCVYVLSLFSVILFFELLRLKRRKRKKEKKKVPIFGYTQKHFFK